MAQQKAKLLLVDDLDENLRALEAILKIEETEIFKAKSGTQALQLLLEHTFAVAILDVHMPMMDGFELAELMRGMERTRHIPIIFVTAEDRNADRAFSGYESGAVDFLYKPLDPRIVRSKVKIFVELENRKNQLEDQLEKTEKIVQDLQETKTKLNQALEIRSQFFSIASHELKTPITSLQLQIQMMLRQIKPKENIAPSLDKLTHSLNVCSIQVDRLTALIEDLLDISRIQAGKLSFRFAPVSLDKLLHEIADRFTDHLQAANCPIEIKTEKGIVGEWDQARLEQVIVNLLSNVSKYATGKPVVVSAKTEDEFAVISVKDQGPGIPKEKHSLIFERFERATASRNISGLGIGLFIVKQIVQGHGGEIWVESDGKNGSTFFVKIPLHRPHDSAFSSQEEMLERASS